MGERRDASRDYSTLGCDAVVVANLLRKFRRSMLTPSSRLSNRKNIAVCVTNALKCSSNTSEALCENICEYLYLLGGAGRHF
jgi:hypothetical protein